MYCQKCRAPLHLDKSLAQLNPISFKLLSDTTSSTTLPGPSETGSNSPKQNQEEYWKAARDSSNGPTYNRTVPMAQSTVSTGLSSPGRDDLGTMSFVMLSESQVMPVGSESDGENFMSSQMEKASRIFDIQSSRSDIDHPVCVECSHTLINGLQTRLNNATKERDAYMAFLRHTNVNAQDEEEIKRTRKLLGESKAKHAVALEQLESLENEERKLQDEMDGLDAELAALDKEEDQFWADRNEFSRKLQAAHGERDRLANRYGHDSKQLHWLQRTNVYNDTFCISYEGTFGIINGLRLGRLPECPVDWTEINAAWGQACLLLAILAEKIDYKFKGYRLNPMGSHSTIDKIEYPSTLSSFASGINFGLSSSTSTATRGSNSQARPTITTHDLFYSGDFIYRKFDTAMIEFLECLKQLGEHVENMVKAESVVPLLEPGSGSNRTAQGAQSDQVNGIGHFQMPYKIHHDKINKVSIRTNGAEWTNACRYTLTCCKYLLAYVSHRSIRNGAGDSSTNPRASQPRTAGSS